jgi:MFS transporter, PPP family, 3-phenylpropionic acid transporter
MRKAIPFAFNFVYYGGFACLAPFIILYYQGLGFSGLQISLILGIAPLVVLFSSPLLTNLADKTLKHKLVMSIGLVIVIATMLIYPFLRTFAPILALVLTFNIFLAPITSFADSATMHMLGAEKELFGRLRLGGTLGWGFSGLVAGALIQRYGLMVSFAGCGLMLFLALLISQGFSFGKPPAAEKPSGDMRILLKSRRWLLFLALAFVGGIAIASISSYYSPYLKELGASDTLIGASLLMGSLSEVPVFFFSDRLIKKFKARDLLTFALLITGLRSLLFAAAGTPILGVLAQLLQGFTYPIFWIAGVSYADEHAPIHLKSTAQGLFGAMTFGFGAAVGCFMGGLLLESIGGRGLFLTYGIVVLLGLAIVTVIEKQTSEPDLQAGIIPVVEEIKL